MIWKCFTKIKGTCKPVLRSYMMKRFYFSYLHLIPYKPHVVVPKKSSAMAIFSVKVFPKLTKLPKIFNCGLVCFRLNNKKNPPVVSQGFRNWTFSQHIGCRYYDPLHHWFIDSYVVKYDEWYKCIFMFSEKVSTWRVMIINLMDCFEIQWPWDSNFISGTRAVGSSYTLVLSVQMSFCDLRHHFLLID